MRAVEPHGVVEARHLDVRDRSRCGHARRSRCRAASCPRDRRGSPPAAPRSSGTGPGHAHPDVLVRRQLVARGVVLEDDRLDLERTLARPEFAGWFRARAGRSLHQFELGRQLSGCGTSSGIASGAPARPRRPGRSTRSEKIAWPCWIAMTRRVVNEPPSRSRSTS